MAGDPMQNLAAMNPNLNGSMGSQQPPTSTLNGGRILGLLPPDTGGFLNGTQGFVSGSILNGGLAGMGSSAQKPPGMLARFMASIRDDFLNMAKNDPGPQAIMGTANASDGGGGGGGGATGGGGADFASMADGIGLPPGVTGGIPSYVPDSGLARPTISSARDMGGADEGFGIG